MRERAILQAWLEVAVKVHVDPAADALYIRLNDTGIVETEEVRPGVIPTS